MAAAQKFSPNLQFTLGFLLYVTTLVVLFYALRRSYLMTAFDLEDAIERARNVPTLLTLAAALLAATIPQAIPGRGLWPISRGAILGIAVGLLSSLALAIEFGEGVRRISAEYWNWWNDWPRVAPYLVVATIQSGGLAATILQVAQLWRNRKVRPMPSSSSSTDTFPAPEPLIVCSSGPRTVVFEETCHAATVVCPTCCFPGDGQGWFRR